MRGHCSRHALGDRQVRASWYAEISVSRRQVFDKQGVTLNLERAGRGFLRLLSRQVLIVVQCGALGFWLVKPGLGWAIVAGCLGVCSLIVQAASRRRSSIAVAAVGLVASFLALSFSWRVREVETEWPELREEILSSAGEELSRRLSASVELARDLADSAATVDLSSQRDAFEQLESIVGSGGPERGAVVLDTSGTALAWAGRHRVAPVPGPAPLSARVNQFYVLLEAQRQLRSTIGMGQLVLWADSAVPDRSETVAARFSRETGTELRFYRSWEAPSDVRGVFDYTLGSDTLFSVEIIPPAQGDLKLEITDAGGRLVATGLLLTLVLFTLSAPVLFRWIAAGGISTVLIFTPAGNRIGLGGIFSEATYFLGALGPFSASAGALLVVTALCTAALSPLSRKGLTRHWIGLALAAGFVVSAPFAISALANGITPPSSGVGLGLWVTWETMLTVASTVVLLATAFLVRGRVALVPPVWTTWCVIFSVAGIAVLGIYIWAPVVGWPVWYAFLWIPPILMSVLPAPRLQTVTSVSVVAGAGAALLTWGAVVEGRLLLAERDAGRVKEGDAVPMGYLERLGEELLEGDMPSTTAELYALWRHSFLSQQDYPAVLASWGPDAEELVRLDLADLDLSSELLQATAIEQPGSISVTPVNRPAGVIYLAAVPFPDGSVLTIGVGPRSRLIEPARLARFLRGERRVIAPYEMSVRELPGDIEDNGGIRWRRDGWKVLGVTPLEQQPGVRMELLIDVSLGDLSRSLVRGALLLVWNVVLIAMLWALGEALAGRAALPAWIGGLIAIRSYRARLALVLSGFFILPTLGYAAWTVQRLRGDAERSRDLLISQTLSDASETARQFVDLDPNELRERLTDLTMRLNTDLIWYDGGVLSQARPAVLAELGLLGHFMPPDVYRSAELREESEVTADVAVGGRATRMGYRQFRGAFTDGEGTLAVPRLVDVRDIHSEQEDVFYGLLLATLIGLAAAAKLSALAARSLADPVRSLRDAAVAVGSGKRPPPFDPGVPTEFVSVVDAFERMASDIERSRSALEAARRRTATVLKNVATGVIALDREMRVMIANPRAEELLSAPLPSGSHIHVLGGADWVPVWKWVRGFLNGRAESDSSEFTVGELHIRAQISAMHGEPSGCVLALDDTTELARAVRVLAWGELARQIAHEIKNPLTPIRLGVQHLKRSYGDPRGDFGHTLDRTAQQILAEIERLDSIARAFARFGAPLAESTPLAPAELGAIARETAELYAFGGETNVVVRADDSVVAKVRRDEVKEVLVNLIENARDGDATEVTITVGGERPRSPTITVTDDGKGIPRSDLPHVFEPQFSTTTSGTGLGLAICKRLVESWGGSIELDSRVGEGTTVRIELTNDSEPD